MYIHTYNQLVIYIHIRFLLVFVTYCDTHHVKIKMYSHINIMYVHINSLIQYELSGKTHNQDKHCII